MTKSASTPEQRLYEKSFRLEYFTVGYNILEAAASLAAGAQASSIALKGFGLDNIDRERRNP
jgi:hypothetical protein